MSSTPHKKNVVENVSIQADGNVHIGDITYNFNDKEVKIPHRLTNNIPTNSDHILGRATELAQAHDHLAQHQATVLFNGIGGIGKTALASKYMALYGAEYKHLAWITVHSTLAEAFTNNAPLLASLQITQQVQDYIAAKQLDKAFEYLFHQLNLLERTLVVIDNANDLDDLDQYKNWFDTAHCHFLITSRSQPSEWAIVEVDSLPEDEAVRLFRKLHPSVSADDEAIKNLLSKLFYHTLLIELVAKAGATTGIPFADLQRMIETKFIHDEQLNEDIVNTGRHGDYYETKRAKIEEYIWLIFSNVKDLGDDAKQILRGMALLPVATPFERDFLKMHLALFEVKDIVTNLSLLVERGWLEKEQNKWFKMHPLIADVVVEHLKVDVDFGSYYIHHTARLINYDNLNPNHNLFEKSNFKRFAERLSELFFDKNTWQTSYLFDRLSYLEENFGSYEKAAKYSEYALRASEKSHNTNSEIIATRLNNLAWVYKLLERNEQAVILFEKAFKILQKKHDENHPHIATNRSNLALVYKDLNRNVEAAELLETALKSNLKNYGEDHPSVALCRGNLGLVYTELKDYEKAINLLEKSLFSDLKNFKENHPNIAISQCNLAVVYMLIDKRTDAKELFQKAYHNLLNNFGYEHPSTIYAKEWLYTTELLLTIPI